MIQTTVERGKEVGQIGVDDIELPVKEEQKSRFIHLRAQGHSYARITKELRASKGTLVNWTVELEDGSDKRGALAGSYIRLYAFIAIYSARVEELKEKRFPWESGEARLEKALKMLPAIDPEKPKPSPDSLKQLKDDTLKDAQGEEWLRIKVRSVEYDDGFNFKEMVEE